VAGLTAEHRTVPFDIDAVARDLRARLHPNAEFLGAVLTGRREQYAHPEPVSNCGAGRARASPGS
jgi:hypothetical protein